MTAVLAATFLTVGAVLSRLLLGANLDTVAGSIIGYWSLIGVLWLTRSL